MNKVYDRQNNVVSIWLGLMCFAIIVMIFIGGLTRLTESGLSMTEWHPISGIIPPMNDVSWGEEFAKYQQSPEYIKHNSSMNLEEFKSIFWLEFIHRIAGRVISLLYFLPLIFFFVKGSINKRDSVIYLLATILLAGQGLMGWYMVKSGLVMNPHVSHYRLAAHLMLAIFLYALLFWQLMKNYFDIMLLPIDTRIGALSFLCIISVILLFIQIAFGAFVAGLDAGLVYNSFPMMGDNFVPHEVSEARLTISSFSDPVFVQFVHRIIAYTLFVVISVLCVCGLRLQNKHFSKAIFYIFVALSLQLLAGVMVLLHNVPIFLALIHQLGAVFLLSTLLWAYFLLAKCN